MIKQALMACLLGLFLAGCGWFDEPLPPGEPALWEISSDDGIEGYLFGTIHALPDGVTWSTPKIDEAFANSDILAVEVAELDNPKLFQQLAYTKNSGFIENRVSPGLRRDVIDLAEDYPFLQSQLRDVEDWAAALTIASLNRDAEPENGVDRALMARAKSPPDGSDPIPLFALEGLYKQLRIFDTMSADDQKSMLESAVEQYEEGPANSASLRDHWLNGRLEQLQAELLAEFEDEPELYRLLMTDRNYAMERRLAKALEKPAKVFVAIGAAHMLTETGLPTLLRKRGYTVTRIQ